MAAAELGTELLLIRHGRAIDVVPGSPESVDPPLSSDGVSQAAALVARLASKQIQAVYASTLRRAIETAQPVAAARNLAVEQLHDLREVELGEWAMGEFRRRAMARDPEWMAFARSGRWDLVPGSEGDDVFRSRVRRAVETLVEAHGGETLAIVCHGGVINAYCAEIFGLERSFFLTIENTSVTLVRVGAEQSVVMTVNDCHHLYDPVLGEATLA